MSNFIEISKKLKTLMETVELKENNILDMIDAPIDESLQPILDDVLNKLEDKGFSVKLNKTYKDSDTNTVYAVNLNFSYPQVGLNCSVDIDLEEGIKFNISLPPLKDLTNANTLEDIIDTLNIVKETMQNIM